MAGSGLVGGGGETPQGLWERLITAALGGGKFATGGTGVQTPWPFPINPNVSKIQNLPSRLGNAALRTPAVGLDVINALVGEPVHNLMKTGGDILYESLLAPETPRPPPMATAPSVKEDGLLPSSEFDARFMGQRGDATPGALPQSNILASLGGIAPSFAPNYSEMDKWLEMARPKGASEAERMGFTDDLLWQGLLAGASNIDASQPGSLGAAIASLGAGASEGKSRGTQFRLEDEEAERDESQDYALARGDIAFKKAQAQAAAQREAWESMQPKILSANKDSIVIQRPNPKTGKIEIQAMNLGTELDMLEEQAKVFKALGVETGDTYKYDFLRSRGNVSGYKMEMVRDLIRQGLGPTTFGEAYTAHKKDVIAGLDNSIITDEDELQKAVENEVAARLFMDLQENDDWIVQAAKLGNPGAQALVRELAGAQ